MVKLKDKQSAKEVLKNGMQGDFWNLILEGLKDSKENLRSKQDSDDLKELPADMYKVESELLKAKIKYLDKLSKLPESLISWLGDPDNKVDNFDPYDEPRVL